MEFGEQDVRNAAGKILVHSVRLRDGVLRKGHVLGPADVLRLERAGRRTVAVAGLEAGDLPEDEAAGKIAESLSSRGLAATEATTGRANLRAEKAGLLLVNRGRIDRLNGIDEAVTLATVAPFAALEVGKIAATVKIVPFGVSSDVVRRWLEIAGRRPAALRLKPFRPRLVALVQTLGPKETVLDKTRRVMEERLRPLRCGLAAERRCAHAAGDIAAALRELGDFDIVLVLGASAIADRRDVVPRAVELAGGAVERLGMPVDPGHLTLLARVGTATVLGLPGSARSPRLHGSDWILQRLVAGVAVGPDDVRRMGVGGLLKELPGRPAPRDPLVPHRAGPPRVAALRLAAGQSRRMGRANKMLAEIDGEAMVVRTARAPAGSPGRPGGGGVGPPARPGGPAPGRAAARRGPGARAGRGRCAGWSGTRPAGCGGPFPGWMSGSCTTRISRPGSAPPSARASRRSPRTPRRRSSRSATCRGSRPRISTR